MVNTNSNDILEFLLLYENCCIFLIQASMKFVPIQLSEPMMILFTDAYVSRILDEFKQFEKCESRLYAYIKKTRIIWCKIRMATCFQNY